MAEYLECVEVETGTRPVATVIWLHGLGADGHDFEPIVPELRIPAELPIRFVFPHAPVRPVTMNGGYQMRAWFDLGQLNLDMSLDKEGFDASRQSVEALLAREKGRGMAYERIVLAGFSQGGAVALYTGLQYPQQLAGIMGLSTFLPVAAEFDFSPHPANADTPVLLAHGTQDAVVAPAFAEATRAKLAELRISISWHTYPMAHAVCAEEIRDIRSWLLQVLDNRTV